MCAGAVAATFVTPNRQRTIDGVAAAVARSGHGYVPAVIQTLVGAAGSRRLQQCIAESFRDLLAGA
jgi:hypothetical protein